MAITVEDRTRPKETLRRRQSATQQIIANKPTSITASAVLKIVGDLLLDWAIVPFANGFVFGGLNAAAWRFWDARRFARGSATSQQHSAKGGVVAELTREAVG
ncbi:hypothetical protein HDU88_000770 [Geranomyces variabilis]|nr:hypothetical protein HDU88_000770 [Geranomyces variabilis]